VKTLGAILDKATFNKIYSPRYEQFFQLCEHIGDSLNGRKDRFDKADLIEAAFEAMTGGSLEWVDDIGCDLEDKRNNLRFECKTQKNLFWTRTGNVRKNQSTSKIKLTNTLQQSDNKRLESTADYLILVDTTNFAIGILSYQDVIEKYSIEEKDGFSCIIPLSAIEILCSRSREKVPRRNIKGYKQRKMNLQRDYVRSFINES
jgi:hypothetical protein